MLYFPFALILCGPSSRSSAVVGALASATDLRHLDCSRGRLPEVDDWPDLPPMQRPLMVLSSVQGQDHLKALDEHLRLRAIDFATVKVTPAKARRTTSEQSIMECDFEAVPQPHEGLLYRRSPALVRHTLRTAHRLVPSAAVQLEVPVGEVTFVVPRLSSTKEEAELWLSETKHLGNTFCRLFNADLPRTCSRCGRDTAVGLPCFNCGQEVEVRAQTLLPTETGYLAVSADAHDEITLRLNCHSSIKS